MTQFKQNNTDERVVHKPLSENGFPVNLDGATAEFYMVKGAVTYINAPAYVDEANDQLVYEFTAQDTLYEGVYTGEFRVVFQDGTIKHYPEKGYLKVTIDKVLNPDETTASEENIALYVSEVEVFKSEVNAKLVNVETATTSANEATTSANEAAIHAQTQGDYAKREADRLVGTDVSTLDTRITSLDTKVEDVKRNSAPRKHTFGGQLAKLKESLSNPLEQFTGIVFIGDSITWGRTLLNNASYDPRDGTLSDPRDNFISPSFVNEFKRYIGSQHANGSAPVLVNWAASPSGQAIAEYTVQHILYPKGGDFTTAATGSSVSSSDVATGSSLTGYQLQLTDGNVAGTSYQSVSFKFTGDTFTLSFGVIEADATFYDLYVDGVKIGTYSTHVGSGIVEGNNQQRVHTFGYVRGKTVEIRSNRNGENTGNRRLRLEAIIINKKIRITNQGINGATVKSYSLYNLAGNTYGDGEAVGAKDNYVFVQLGTNDRIIRTDTPKGSNTFKSNLKALLDKVIPLSNVILMCANPATENPASYSFTMQGVRDVVYRTAKENSFDMIDNYSVFEGLDMTKLTTDGVHPNESGHKLMATNIINSLEAS